MESTTERKILLEFIITQRHRGQTLLDRQRRVPLVFQDIHENRAVVVDVWVVDLGQEADLGGLEWIIGGKCDGEEEDAASIRRITLDHANSS